MTLILNNLLYERNYEALFHSVNCTLQPGEMLQIHGANGSGKSTLLRILAGFIQPKQGDVTWQGQSIFKLGEYQQQLHYIGHQNGMRLRLTVYENIKLHGALLGRETQKSVLQYFDLINLSEKQAMHLSAGQMRRLALTRLLLNPAKLWILDEPMTALDKIGQALLLKLLDAHVKQGGMAVIATHQDLGVGKVIDL